VAVLFREPSSNPAALLANLRLPRSGIIAALLCGMSQVAPFRSAYSLAAMLSEAIDAFESVPPTLRSAHPSWPAMELEQQEPFDDTLVGFELPRELLDLGSEGHSAGR
jgi:hypothetical protein